MVICPIAVAVGCKRCPAFAVCPLKTVIGDYRPDEHVARNDAPARARSGKPATSTRAKPASNRKGARARRPRK